MRDKPDWYPLHVDFHNRYEVREVTGATFALAHSKHNAALIVLIMNKAAELQDFSSMRQSATSGN